MLQSIYYIHIHHDYYYLIDIINYTKLNYITKRLKTECKVYYRITLLTGRT
jgi:hypothetical protein